MSEIDHRAKEAADYLARRMAEVLGSPPFAPIPPKDLIVAIVALTTLEQSSRDAWQTLCDLSRRNATHNTSTSITRALVASLKAIRP